MRVFIHDLEPGRFAALGLARAGDEVIAADGRFAACRGCFGCWLQKAGECVMGDSLSDAARRIQSGDELCIISRCVFGGYSPRVKTVLDRSIGVSLPFFTLRGGETHHIPRGGARGRLLACFYGEATDAERDTAARMVERNRLNFGRASAETRFAAEPEEFGRRGV